VGHVLGFPVTSPTTSHEHVLVERDDSLLIITINRPKVLNALNRATLSELDAAMASAADDESVRVVLLTGAGDKAFVAGADITELATATPGELSECARFGQAVFDRIDRLGKPVIAAVNGFALGGGCELALACTVRLAAETAKFGQPEVNLGLLPGYGGSQRLPRLVGRGRAVEMLLTARTIGADEALRIGLVSQVVPAAELMASARKMGQLLAAKSPVAVRLVLDAVAQGLEMPLDRALRHEADLFGQAGQSEDMREGTRAFLDKRPPVFRGR
jgi:enoyl-CoA hydratase